MSPERVVTRAIIQDEQNRVLLGLRARGHGANQWALVGGKPDKGEKLEDAIVREVSEELGADFVNTRFYLEKVDNDTDPQNPWRVIFYTGELAGNITIKKDEILEIRYVSKEDLDKLDIAFDHKDRLLEFFTSQTALQTNSFRSEEK